MAEILIVDDELQIRRPLRILLERAGHRVREAQDGQEAIRMWRERPGDLVITDIHMPEKDGIETILELRALTPGLRIIAISGGLQTRHLDLLGDATLLGAVLTVPKPFTLAEILAAVSQALQTSSGGGCIGC
ncbi:MAG: response regulator [Gemmatimonadales bacterium]|jgi:CheY-like chemotaxis protein|nr:response regulator [Gemmatimonadales bacterium]